MNLIFKETLQKSCLVLTDFSCADGRNLLEESNLYKILWVKKDIDSLLIDGCTYTLKKDEFIFCTPLNVIEIALTRQAIVSVVFNREFYCIRDNDDEVSCNGLLFYGSSSPVIIMPDASERKIFEQIYAVIEEELIERNRSHGEMLRVMLKRLIIKSTRLIETRSRPQGEASDRLEVIRAFHILVEKNFKTHHKLTNYAILMQKSPKTISNIFSEHSTTTPLQVINERVFVEARRLLLYSKKSIVDISTTLGYKDASHFSKFFKRNAGLSPIKFKNKFLKNQ